MQAISQKGMVRKNVPVPGVLSQDDRAAERVYTLQDYGHPGPAIGIGNLPVSAGIVKSWGRFRVPLLPKSAGDPWGPRIGREAAPSCRSALRLGTCSIQPASAGLLDVARGFIPGRRRTTARQHHEPV